MAFRFTLLLLSIFLLLSSSTPSVHAQRFGNTVTNIINKLDPRKVNEKTRDFQDLMQYAPPSNSASPPAANLVSNGGFEEGSQYPGWTTKGVHLVHAKDFNVPSGNYAVELVGNKSSLYQDITTTPKKLYILSFIVWDPKNACNGNMMVLASAAGKIAKPVTFESVEEGHTQERMFPFKATGDKTRIQFLRFDFHTKSNELKTGCGPVIDEVRVVPLPLPV